MAKARNDKFDHKHHHSEQVMIDNRNIFLRTWQAWNGTTVVEAVVEGVSLKNKAEKARLRKLAHELHRLADTI